MEWKGCSERPKKKEDGKRALEQGTVIGGLQHLERQPSSTFAAYTLCANFRCIEGYLQVAPSLGGQTGASPNDLF
jgi:hypothetical protein